MLSIPLAFILTFIYLGAGGEQYAKLANCEGSVIKFVYLFPPPLAAGECSALPC